MPTAADSRTEIAARLRMAIVRTSRRLRQEGGSGLSASLTSALSTLERCGPLTPSELAGRERLARPAITRTIARLEGDGLVARVPDPADGRSYRVGITRRGERLLRSARRRSRAYLARALRTLDEDELAVLDAAAAVLERLFEEKR